MSDSVVRYEQNLDRRLEELRAGDPAYVQHIRAISEAVVLTLPPTLNGEIRLLDAGCGLGFLSAELQDTFPKGQVVGVDVSRDAIALASSEHPNAIFLESSIQDLPELMEREGIPPFTHAVLNMVLHSVDNRTVVEILQGVHRCLLPGGILIFCVPTPRWLVCKLIEIAQERGMDKDRGVLWVSEQLKQVPVKLTYKIRGGETHQSSLIVYNRTLADYARLLFYAGFGISIHATEINDEVRNSQTLAFYDLSGSIKCYAQRLRERPVLVTSKMDDFGESWSRVRLVRD